MRDFLYQIGPSELLNQMAKDQEELNQIYNPEWKSVSPIAYSISALHEFTGEFMKEIEGLWSFFGNKPVDIQKAIFELTDFWFFYMSRCLVAETAPRAPSYVLRCLQEDQTDNIRIAHSLKLLSEEISNPLCTDPNFMLECVRLVVTKILGQPFKVFIEAYEIKRERNLHRAANGALDGTYDKSQETELKLELLK